MKTFSNIIEKGNNLLLVDGLNMAFSFRGKTGFEQAYLKMIESLKRSYKCSKVVICVDKGSSAYRKFLYPEYKYNRKIKQESQTEQEQEEFISFFETFEKSIELVSTSTNYPIIRFPGVEADDTIAYICSKIKNLPIDNIWIVSSDRDLNLLIDEGVSQFSYATRKEFTIDNWPEHYEFSRDEYISIKCLMGDSGDNVPGVPGIGPKRALQLVQEYGSTYDIIANLPLPGKYKYIEALNKFGEDNLILNYKLMDLVTYCAEALGEDNCKTVENTLNQYLG